MLPPILAAIGNTPLIELRRIVPAGSVRLVALLLLFPTFLSAQDSVTATSGDRRVIAQIRRQYQETESRLARLRVDSLDLDGFSAEGGQLVAYWEGQRIRKIVARHYGETGRTLEEFYYSAGQAYFILVVTEQYTEPLSGVVEGTLEHRFYLTPGRIIRIVRSQHPPADSLDMRFRDPDVTELRRDAARFVLCAEARKSGATTCAAND